MNQDTFSESWYRIAGENIRLRTGIDVRRQNFRGERWFVLENSFSNQFFRLRPAAYEFVARLNRNTTVQEAWERCLEIFPDDTPGQGEVIKLLSQLYHANLLAYDLANDARQLFDRQKKRHDRELKARLTNIMFMRFPLINPDRFLVKTLPLVRPLLGKLGTLLWFVVAILAGKLLLDNNEKFWDETQGVLTPSNLLWLYFAMAITKTLHEFGHAYVCRKYGGEIHVMGIMLLIFTPIPYVDATSSWGFRSKWQRLLVGGAGMIVEIFVAALAVFVWANTGPGTLHNLAYNMIFVASVSTVLFNINPLLRFDGYYMLSDLVEVPNLHQKATNQLKYFCKRYLFGLRQATNPSDTKSGAFWLTAFALASQIYRLVIFGGILFFVADRFLLLGIIMAGLCITGWIVVPVLKFIHYLASSPELARGRRRAVMVTVCGFASVLAFLQFVPFPLYFKAPGVFESQTRAQVLSDAPGIVAEFLAVDGQTVEAGDPLLRLTNPEIDLALRLSEAKIREQEAKLRLAMRAENADLKPIQLQLDAERATIAKLLIDRKNLTIRARVTGTYVAPAIEQTLGRHFDKGSPFGIIVDPGNFEFTATVKQEDADQLFTRNLDSAEVRIPGQAGQVIIVENLLKIPSDQNVLPSSALGWGGGGDIQTDPRDPDGRKTQEPFFSVRADIRDSSGATLLHGRSAKIRFAIGKQPLLPRWVRSFRQLLQRRFQV